MGRASAASATAVGSPTMTPTASGSRTRRRWRGSASWRSRPPGRRSGSAPTRSGTCRRPGSTPPVASSTSTTSAGTSARSELKFEAVREFAAALPLLRRAVTADLRRQGMPRERALACAVRLLDLGFFRVGGEVYAEDNESFGLATVRREHVSIRGVRSSSTSRPRGDSAGCSRFAIPAVRARDRRRCADGAAAPTTFSPGATAGSGVMSVPTTSTRTSRRRSESASRPRTSAPGMAPFWPRSSWPASRSRHSEAAAKRAISGRDRAGRRCARQHARRSVAAPMSTRG